MKKLSTLLLLSLLTACYNPALSITGMPKAPTEGPEDYIEGWKAGCETGMTTYGNSYYRTRYRTHVDGERMVHSHYSKGWELGQRYCAYYSSTYLGSKEMSYASNDGLTKSDLRADNTWINLKSDGWFNYEIFSDIGL